jgi:hypothetical protein
MQEGVALHPRADEGGLAARAWATGRSFVTRHAAVVFLAALVATLVALFLPFAHLVCVYCPALLPGETSSGSLIGGMDGPILLSVVIGAMLTGLLYVWGIARVVASALALILSLTAMAFVFFDASGAAVRVLYWKFSIFAPPLAGFYLAAFGAAAATLCAYLMLVRASQSRKYPSVGDAPAMGPRSRNGGN